MSEARQCVEGSTRLSKSQVSLMAAEVDETVQQFRTRPLDAGPYAFVVADALVLEVREGCCRGCRARWCWRGSHRLRRTWTVPRVVPG